MIVCSISNKSEDKSVSYDLSSVITTLKVAKMKNLKNGSNLAYQMEKLLKELSIINDTKNQSLDELSNIL